VRDDLRALRRRLSWWQATARRLAEGAIVRIDLTLGGEP
jgi:hypothetical protein